MSYAMDLYSVPLGYLRSLVGSRNDRVLAEIEEEDEFFDDLEQMFQEHTDEEEDAPSCREALWDILAGGPYRPGWDTAYLYSVELLCRHAGGGVDNRAFQPPIRWGWIEEVDRVLAHLKFPLRVADLASGGPPIDVPAVSGIPSIGWWPRQPYAPALAILKRYRPDGLRAELAEALVTIMGGLHQALQGEDDVLVGIYS